MPHTSNMSACTAYCIKHVMSFWQKHSRVISGQIASRMRKQAAAPNSPRVHIGALVLAHGVAAFCRQRLARDAKSREEVSCTRRLVAKEPLSINDDNLVRLEPRKVLGNTTMAVSARG